MQNKHLWQISLGKQKIRNYYAPDKQILQPK